MTAYQATKTYFKAFLISMLQVVIAITIFSAGALLLIAYAAKGF